MTAPSLLDELEGIVRLAEKATPGPFVVDGYGDVTANGEDVARIASDGYSAYHDAHLFADAVNFIRAHHAEIADMTKRLEASQSLAAAMYQAAGAYNMPVRFLDVLSAAGNGKPITEAQVDALLPCETPDTLQRLEATEMDASRYRWLRGGDSRLVVCDEDTSYYLEQLDAIVDAATQDGE